MMTMMMMMMMMSREIVHGHRKNLEHYFKGVVDQFERSEGFPDDGITIDRHE